MKNVSKLLLTVAFLVSATAIQAYNAAATQELQQLLNSTPKFGFQKNAVAANRIKELIAKDANPNLTATIDNMVITPIAAAVYTGDLDAVKAVVNAGATVVKRSNANGVSTIAPLSAAISGGPSGYAIAEFLINEGQFDRDDLNYHLGEARGYGSPNLARALEDQGAGLTKARL